MLVLSSSHNAPSCDNWPQAEAKRFLLNSWYSVAFAFRGVRFPTREMFKIVWLCLVVCGSRSARHVHVLR